MKNTKNSMNTGDISNQNGGHRHSMVFIQGNIPSSKNSKVATSTGVFHSKTVAKFLREQGILHYSAGRKEVTYYKTRPCIFPVAELSQLFSQKTGIKPAKIGIHFVRQTKAKFDFHNICQILFDLMVAFDIIDDDNMDCVLPFPMEIDGKWYSVDKNKPGVWIAVI